MQIKVVIIDDEELGIDSLKWELKRLDYPLEIVRTFSNPEEGLDYLRKEKIDLLFLDIQMPGLTGFELLNQLDDIHFSVVFATSYDEYALKAFKYSALDYLLKPIEQAELGQVLEKYIERNKEGQNKIGEQLRLHTYALQGTLPGKVVFATKETMEFLDPGDILYCEAISNYTSIFSKNGKLVVSKTLKEVENVLRDYGFIRVHRSYIINPKYITRYIKTLGGSIMMDDGKEISVSRSYKDSFVKLIFNNQ